jgi:hypothetical protein
VLRLRPGTGVEAAFTTRAEGNLATHVGDDPVTVEARRWSVAVALGVDGVSWCEQVHGNAVAVVTEPGRTYAATDALVTDVPRAPLAVMAADCVPVLLAGGGVVGAAHAGRGGLVKGVVEATVRAMRDLGAEDVRAVLGPAIGPCCYEVGQDVFDEVVAALPATASATREGKPSLDLVAGVRHVLAAEGVTGVEVAAGCTVDDPARFFSYRRDGRTGRHAGLVWLA